MSGTRPGPESAAWSRADLDQREVVWAPPRPADQERWAARESTPDEAPPPAPPRIVADGPSTDREPSGARSAGRRPAGSAADDRGPDPGSDPGPDLAGEPPGDVSGWSSAQRWPARVATPRRLLRVVLGSLLGAGLLVVAQWLGPAGGAPFGTPHTGRALLGVACGALGALLVPGLWLSALTRVRRGVGPRLVGWLGGTLAWHALAAVAAHATVRGALPTTGVVLGVTVGGSLAACAGLLLAPAAPPVWERAQLAVPLGAGLSLVALPLLRWRLGPARDISGTAFEIFMMVLGALVAAAGATVTRIGPADDASDGAWAPGRASRALAALLAGAVAVGVVVLAARALPTSQVQPPVLTAEQRRPPPGADLALALGGVGAPVDALATPGAFTLLDPAGRPAPASFAFSRDSGGTLLVVTLAPAGRAQVCPRMPVAVGELPLALRDQAAGLHVSVRLQIAASCPAATGTRPVPRSLLRDGGSGGAPTQAPAGGKN